MRAVMQKVVEILDRGDKLIIVSQWTSVFDILERELESVEGAFVQKFTGKVAVKDRQVCKQFQIIFDYVYVYVLIFYRLFRSLDIGSSVCTFEVVSLRIEFFQMFSIPLAHILLHCS